MNDLFIQLKNVYKHFGDNKVLDGVDLTIRRGEITTIIGKSGVGKSVLLKHMIGLLSPDAGKIFFEGRPLSAMKRKERITLKSKFSYMFQGTALFDSMTVYDNIALPLKESSKLKDREIQKLVENRMEQLELVNLDGVYPSQISGGMKKRVALARALVTNPEIVLFDEPTTGLDPIRRNAVFSMISDYQKRFGFTAVIVSHAIPDIFYISQNVAFLNDGKIIFQGTPSEIKASTEPVISKFIHSEELRRADMKGLTVQIASGERRFQEELERLRRHNIDFTIGILTIDNMDELTMKHQFVAFQNIFTQFSSYLEKAIRVTDTSSRYGPYEILLILSHRNEAQAERFTERLVEELKANEDEIISLAPNTDISFKVSLGLIKGSNEFGLAELVEKAEGKQKVIFEHIAG